MLFVNSKPEYHSKRVLISLPGSGTEMDVVPFVDFRQLFSIDHWLSSYLRYNRLKACCEILNGAPVRQCRLGSFWFPFKVGQFSACISSKPVVLTGMFTVFVKAQFKYGFILLRTFILTL